MNNNPYERDWVEYQKSVLLEKTDTFDYLALSLTHCVGNLAQELRGFLDLKEDPDDFDKENIKLRMADILNYLMVISKLWNVDMDELMCFSMDSDGSDDPDFEKHFKCEDIYSACLWLISRCGSLMQIEYSCPASQMWLHEALEALRECARHIGTNLLEISEKE